MHTTLAGANRQYLSETTDDPIPSPRVGGGSRPNDDPWPSVDPLLAALGRMRTTDPRRPSLRQHIVCQCLTAVRREATRFRRSGESFDDLVQVATVGLILAVDRYDPRRGIPFKHFALPTIVGELKRHFRDKGWSVRVTRRVQELYQEVRKAEPQLAQVLGRMPSARDLADHLGLSEADVWAARNGEAAHTARSLNWPAYGDEDATELHERLGGPDRAIESVADHDALCRALPTLPDRLQKIIALRFVHELSQHQIADALGISQMHVSRLLSRGLTMLRRHMTAEEPVGV